MLNLKYILNWILFNKGKKKKSSEGFPHMVKVKSVGFLLKWT